MDFTILGHGFQGFHTIMEIFVKQQLIADDVFAWLVFLDRAFRFRWNERKVVRTRTTLDRRETYSWREIHQWPTPPRPRKRTVFHFALLRQDWMYLTVIWTSVFIDECLSLTIIVWGFVWTGDKAVLLRMRALKSPRPSCFFYRLCLPKSLSRFLFLRKSFFIGHAECLRCGVIHPRGNKHHDASITRSGKGQIYLPILSYFDSDVYDQIYMHIYLGPISTDESASSTAQETCQNTERMTNDKQKSRENETNDCKGSPTC